MGGKVSNSLLIYLFGIKPKNLCSGMNYQKLLEQLDNTTNQVDREYLLDRWFYSINTFTERKINLETILLSIPKFASIHNRITNTICRFWCI